MQNKRRTKAQWLQIFEEQCDSGMTIKAFCAQHDIHLQTFRARKSDWQPARKKPSRALVKIEKPKSKPSASITC